MGNFLGTGFEFHARFSPARADATRASRSRSNSRGWRNPLRLDARVQRRARDRLWMLMARSSQPSATLVVLLALTGGRPCRAQTPSPLQVDRTEYRATCLKGRGGVCSYGFTLVARYKNRTAHSLYLSTCQPRDGAPTYGIPVIDDTTEGSGYEPFWACGGHEFPIVLASGATRVDGAWTSGRFAGRLA